MGIFAIYYRTSGDYYNMIIYFKNANELLKFMRKKYHRWVIYFLEDLNENQIMKIINETGKKPDKNDIIIDLELYDDWRE